MTPFKSWVKAGLWFVLVFMPACFVLAVANRHFFIAFGIGGSMFSIGWLLYFGSRRPTSRPTATGADAPPASVARD